MQMRYSNPQVALIRDQCFTFQCACPAQVCVALVAVRELHAYQAGCLNRTDVDRAVHLRILEAAERTHAELEQCLTDILQLEGWDMNTLKMPEALKKRVLAQS